MVAEVAAVVVRPLHLHPAPLLAEAVEVVAEVVAVAVVEEVPNEDPISKHISTLL